jgi:restriction endonuclease Mrr
MQIHQAQRGVVVTTSSYSQQAIDVAFRHNVDLIDGPKLAAMAASGQLGVST